MSIVQSYKCDVCGTIKKEANHWFVAVAVPQGVHIYTWNAPGAGYDQENVAHLCGMQCTTRFMMRALAEESPASSESSTDAYDRVA